MVKIGQIGIGHNHATAKMSAVRKFPDLFEVVGVCEKNPEWIEKRGNDAAYSGLPFLSEDDLFEKWEALLIETDVWDLTETAARAVSAGKHIHMDKPGGEDLAAYKAMLDIAEKNSLTVQLGYMYRYNPAINMCMEMYKKGEIGEILSITAEMSTKHSAQYRKWLEHFKGGTMYIFGSHLIDLVMLFMGEPQKVTSFIKSTGLDGTKCADNVHCVLEYQKAIAKIYTSSNECNGWGRRQFTVCGTKKTVEIRPLEVPVRMTVATFGEGKEYFDDYARQVDVVEVPDSCRYDEMIKDFYKFIIGIKKNPYTYDYEYKLHITILKACGL